MLNKEITNRKKLTLRTGLAVAATMLIASHAVAHDADSTFEMTVVRNAAYGSDIISGNLQAAIDNITAETFGPADQFIAKNNLCVAYTMSAEFDKAEVACNAAIGIAKEELDLDTPRSHGFGGTERNFALALTNRGVMRAMAGSVGEARSDFEQARALRARTAKPKKNLRYLDGRQTQASID